MSQKEAGKGCALLNLPPCLHILQKAMGAGALVQSQAWQAAARELGSSCLESWWWQLFGPCLIAPAGEASLEHSSSFREKECSRLALSGMRRLARWRHSNQNRLNSALVHFTTCAQGPEDWLQFWFSFSRHFCFASEF